MTTEERAIGRLEGKMDMLISKVIQLELKMEDRTKFEWTLVGKYSAWGAVAGGAVSIIGVGISVWIKMR